jgi:transposase-like protein
MFERWYPSSYNYKAYRESCRKSLRTANVLDKLNPEFKRRTKKIDPFHSDQSLFRLVVTIMININEERITDRRYINMKEN